MAVRDHDLVACEGEWDISRAAEFARLCERALARSGALLILDFRPATFIDASTVGAICTFAQEASRRGVVVAVACDAGLVRRVFELTHLGDVVPLGEGAGSAAPDAGAGGPMFRNTAAAASSEQEVSMDRDPHGQDEADERDPPAQGDDVDEASEESFPASDPPSFGSAEPDGGTSDRT